MTQIPDETPIVTVYSPALDHSMTLCRSVMVLISPATLKMIHAAREALNTLPESLNGVTFDLEGFTSQEPRADAVPYDPEVHSEDAQPEDASWVSLIGEMNRSGQIGLIGNIDGGTAATFSTINVETVLEAARRVLGESAAPANAAGNAGPYIVAEVVEGEVRGITVHSTADEALRTAQHVAQENGYVAPLAEEAHFESPGRDFNSVTVFSEGARLPVKVPA